MSCEAPVILNITASKVMTKIDFLSLNTKVAQATGKEKSDFCCFTGGVFLSSMSTAGKTINEMISDIEIPALIIHPRLITGWI